MRTIKSILLFAVIVLFFGCGSDDNGDTNEPTNLELLISGKWYNESRTPGSYTDCEKNGYIEFMTNGDAVINSFDDGSGTCQSLGAVTASWTLTNEVDLNLTLGPESVDATIIAISSSEMTVVGNGETIVFDKNPG